MKFYILFNFIDDLTRIGRQKNALEEEDLPLQHADVPTVSGLCQQFSEAFSQYSKFNMQLRILLSIMKGRWFILVITGVGEALGSAAALLGPVLLGRIVAGLSSRQTEDGSWDPQSVYLCALCSGCCRACCARALLR